MWIGKFDGSLQCGLGVAVPLPVVEAELKHIVGEVKHSEPRRWPGMVNQACGLPTGACYAFEVDDEAVAKHREALGAHRYFPWPVSENEDRGLSAHATPARDWAPSPFKASRNGDGVPFPYSVQLGADALPWPWRVGGIDDGFFPWMNSGRPTLLHSLIGKHCRLYKTGDVLTTDMRPDRANIELGQDGRIVSVWFG